MTTNWLTKYLGATSLYIIRKFFGIIVLAIACKLMFANFIEVLHPSQTEAEPQETVILTENNNTDEKLF